ncbi:hypothetical protein GOB40_33285 [Sinorhizobium meliloti]|nr:hypothetical protein [Sinorhizobium meliloti]MDW9622050.1 hypothetical protein [Sinorhizobium meliloti]MDX0011433.1 hypothetical protein [Sinorhizobium meliloti]MDX0160246.1 hypothetical protein [Sinorhizobium meliloti]MDX0179271.1 hypothetical protein [Sinorhizobium meliloti]
MILLGKGKSLLAGSKRAARPCRRRSREHPLHKLALKDTLTTPVGGGFRSVNVWLRESFGAYANVRPAKTIVRGGPRGYRYRANPNLEGFYVAVQHFIAVGDDRQAVASSHDISTKAECRRIIRYAFEYALASRVAVDECIVDDCAMLLV